MGLVGNGVPSGLAKLKEPRCLVSKLHGACSSLSTNLSASDALERAAVEFARSALGELIGSAVDAMVAELFIEVCGPFGFPIDDDA